MGSKSTYLRSRRRFVARKDMNSRTSRHSVAENWALFARVSTSRGTTRRSLSTQNASRPPERSKRSTWSTFLKAHWEVLCSSDLILEVWTGRGLVTHYLLYLLFVISLADRSWTS